MRLNISWICFSKTSLKNGRIQNSINCTVSLIPLVTDEKRRSITASNAPLLFFFFYSKFKLHPLAISAPEKRFGWVNLLRALLTLPVIVNLSWFDRSLYFCVTKKLRVPLFFFFILRGRIIFIVMKRAYFIRDLKKGVAHPHGLVTSHWPAVLAQSSIFL